MNIKGRPGEYLTDRLTDEADRFLESNREKPFFLYLAHYAVHTPIEGKEDVTSKYQRKVRPGDLQRSAGYAAMVESVDDSLGRLLRKLDELGVAERTVVFLMSDNGGVAIPLAYDRQPVPMTSNLPLRAGKAHLYEGGIREPMIVRWPGVTKPGSLTSVPVISTDFFPTILEMAGIKPDPANTIDGMSLAGLLKGQGAPKRDALYWHFPHYDYRPAAAVRQGDWKFMEFMDNGHLELYNLAEDLGERTNLAAQMPEKALAMQQMLHRWQKQVGARMMEPNPDYVPPLLE